MALIQAQIGKDHYLTEIQTTSGNRIVADEPAASGGVDKGFSPSELLASALGACTCITLRMYADRKQWPLEKIEAHVTFVRDLEKNESFMTRTIHLQGTLDARQRERLLEIANQCFIHKTLTHPIHISTLLAGTAVT